MLAVSLLECWPYHNMFLYCDCSSSLLSLFPVKLGWDPDAGYTSPQRWIPTPDQEEVALINAGFPHYNFNKVYVTPVRCAPLPALW